MNARSFDSLACFSNPVCDYVGPITGTKYVMLSSSGTNFGFWRTVPHILGVGLGSPVLLLVLAAGADTLFRFEIVRIVLQALCLLYIAWMAYKIATSKPVDEMNSSQPLSFLKAAAFQWVNPKVWSQYITALAVHIPLQGDFWISVLIVAMIFSFVGIPSAVLWTLLGKLFSRFLGDARRFQVFNIAMAVLLVGSVILTMLPKTISI